jgi:hypothetical protein
MKPVLYACVIESPVEAIELGYVAAAAPTEEPARTMSAKRNERPIRTRGRAAGRRSL